MPTAKAGLRQPTKQLPQPARTLNRSPTTPPDRQFQEAEWPCRLAPGGVPR